MLGAMSEMLRRVVKQCLWENHELTVEHEKLSEENEELREKLSQALSANNSKPSRFSVLPKASADTHDTMAQRKESQTGTSHTETDQVKDEVGGGHGDMGQKANSPLSQGSPCGSDWANVEKPDV